MRQRGEDERSPDLPKQSIIAGTVPPVSPVAVDGARFATTEVFYHHRQPERSRYLSARCLPV
jgi:hypothetical protein